MWKTILELEEKGEELYFSAKARNQFIKICESDMEVSEKQWNYTKFRLWP